jgi:hypothetical protein
VVACCALVTAQAALGASEYVASTPDGKYVVILTAERLSAADTDAYTDIYLVHGSDTTIVSQGPAGGNGDFYAVPAAAPRHVSAISDDGSTVVFSTPERLTGDDGDSNKDLYMWRNGATSLLTHGPAGGDDESWDYQQLDAMRSDGSSVFFSTGESLTSNDNDWYGDVYERWGPGNTSLVTENTGGYGAGLTAISPDGSRRLFSTGQPIAIEDRNTETDAYLRVGYGPPKLMTTGSLAAAGQRWNGVVAASKDLTTVFFDTFNRIEPTDTDDNRDGYRRAGDRTQLITIGPNDLRSPSFARTDAVSDDGRVAYFTARDQLTSDDHDGTTNRTNGYDLYRWDASASPAQNPQLVSVGPAGGHNGESVVFRFASTDGYRALFETREPLVFDDHDSSTDLYEWFGGHVSLVSGGPGIGTGDEPARFAGATESGGIVAFTTREPLVPGDTDSSVDVYLHDSDGFTLVSTGPAGGDGTFDADYAGMYREGSFRGDRRVWFETDEALVAGDINGASDVYEWSPDGVRLLAPQ